MQISKYFCISITSISIRHVICTHNAVASTDRGNPENDVEGVEGEGGGGGLVVCFVLWPGQIDCTCCLLGVCNVYA